MTDQSVVVGEAARVLREGGAIYVACPNCLRFYEPHYNILWAPLLPKILDRIYVNRRGRRPEMLNQLTYTMNRRLRKLLEAFGPDFTVIDLHREQILRKRATSGFAARSSRLAARLTQLPIVGSVFLWALLKYGSIAEGGCEMVVLRKPKAASQ